MKKMISFIIFVVAISGCSFRNETKTPHVGFLESFSLDNTIREMDKSGLEFRTGSMGSAGPPLKQRREFSVELTIPDAVKGTFQPKEFLDQLKSKIEQKLTNSGNRLTGQGYSNNSFYFNYESGSDVGGIDVTGNRTGDDRFLVWCVLRESSGGK
ncbi:MAG: membrane lipoprotein lipid attachment site-containing protein [Acidobacteria bacterium]|nr:membrane lipoprotein lipid attachment site-containing protein [Acidobacteriota bacterium]